MPASLGPEDAIGEIIPDQFKLGQSYPNPFSGQSVIPYELADHSTVRLELYNLLGQRVRLLVDATQPPGRYEANVDASDLGAGLYFYVMTAGDYREVRKMTLVR